MKKILKTIYVGSVWSAKVLIFSYVSYSPFCRSANREDEVHGGHDGYLKIVAINIDFLLKNFPVAQAQLVAPVRSGFVFDRPG